jgi:S-ribosylhomocysteine lyase LuxS involved in autoinducer biosynthesis
MTDAPNTIWVHFSDFDEHDVCTSYPVENAGEYTRTDISQARIAELEAVLQDIAQMHGDNPSTAMADMPDGDYQRYVLSQARRIARAALKAKP